MAEKISVAIATSCSVSAGSTIWSGVLLASYERWRSTRRMRQSRSLWSPDADGRLPGIALLSRPSPAIEPRAWKECSQDHAFFSRVEHKWFECKTGKVRFADRDAGEHHPIFEKALAGQLVKLRFDRGGHAIEHQETIPVRLRRFLTPCARAKHNHLLQGLRKLISELLSQLRECALTVCHLCSRTFLFTKSTMSQTRRQRIGQRRLRV